MNMKASQLQRGDIEQAQLAGKENACGEFHGALVRVGNVWPPDYIALYPIPDLIPGSHPAPKVRKALSSDLTSPIPMDGCS